MRKVLFLIILSLFVFVPAAKAQIIHNVTYNGSNFSPQSITVKKGDTIRWTNTSTSTVQVQSDPHPAHTIYPPLNIGIINPGGGIANLQMNDIGTYGYHNHLNSGQIGTIIVQQAATPTQAQKRGDANNDGRVDGIDYVIWLNHYTQQTTQGQRDGDFNMDGIVNGVDYVTWINNYGT